MTPAELVPWLRAVDGRAGVIADAIEIADSCSRADVECNVPHEGEGAATWYDTKRIKDHDRAMIDQALRYLDARGKLTRKDGAPQFVRPWGPEGP